METETTSLTPRAAKYRVLQTTLIGHKSLFGREENQDRVLHRAFALPAGELHLLAVCDGISRCPAGGDVASYVVEEHLAKDAIFHGNGDSPSPKAQFFAYLNDLQKQFYREFAQNDDMLESGCTMSVALVESEVAHCAFLGDSPIVIARKVEGRFATRQVSTPDLAGRLLTDCFGAGAPGRIKEQQVTLARGDLLIIGSDGAIKEPSRFSRILNEHGPAPELLRAVEEEARSAHFYDDATLILAERLE